MSFKFIPINNQFLNQSKKIENMLFKQKSMELINSIAFVTLAEKGDIDDITALEHLDIFSPWVSGMIYNTGALRKYNDELYRCVQNHTAQIDWTPDIALSLWTKIGDPNEEYPTWSQPIGAHDAYLKGDKVTHNEIKWVSNCDANIWEPGVYGWDIV